jgi:two-component system chemotaxis response regulator CheY
MNLPERFIVVDDDAINNQLCKFAILRTVGETEIDLFTEPDEALSSIQGESLLPDEKGQIVLFLDINMPTMTGWEFLEVFRSLSQAIHEKFTIFMLSSSVDDRDRERAEADPFVSGFFSKPLKAVELKEIFNV